MRAATSASIRVGASVRCCVALVIQRCPPASVSFGRQIGRHPGARRSAELRR